MVGAFDDIIDNIESEIAELNGCEKKPKQQLTKLRLQNVAIRYQDPTFMDYAFTSRLVYLD
ncbi:hypothetical protein ACOMICROBIO_LKFPLAJE_02884 [Vibrio sp. B1FIG11]|nr:hypothetical protein ACOMICROBIO_LKFPLAJE_02884 [Vibrio sp. B1FIG11]